MDHMIYKTIKNNLSNFIPHETVLQWETPSLDK